MSELFDTAPAAFPSPWAARAFALVSAAAETGFFSLQDFQQQLIKAIGGRESAGGCIGDESAYYDCWIESLAALVQARGGSTSGLSRQEGLIQARFATRNHTQGSGEHDHGHTHHHHASVAPQPIFVDSSR